MASIDNSACRLMRLASLVLLFVSFALLGSSLQAAEPSSLPNSICPVMPEEPADAGYKVTIKGQDVYLCCTGCVRKFAASPELYLKNLPQTMQDKILAGGLAADTEQKKFDPYAVMAKWIGRHHGFAVHFPIALIVIAALIEFVGFFTLDRRFTLVATTNLIIGAILSLPAILLGLAAANSASDNAEYLMTLSRHENLALAGSIVALVGAGLGYRAYRAENSDKLTVAYRVFLFSAAALILAAGYYGNELVR